MRAIVVHEWGGPLVLEERPDPVPDSGEAVLRVRAAGVGLTLQHARNGVFGGSPPRIIGHEVAGEIAAIGDEVTGVAVGDRCAVYGYLNCGQCHWCRGGRETLCDAHRGFVGVHTDGGFADLVCLPWENFIPMPAGLDFEAAAIATDAITTTWHCVKERARVAPLDDVLIFGAGGGVGVHAVQMARHFGARVIAVDVSADKLDLARRFGADAVINAREEDVVQKAHDLTGGKGVESAIDFAGFPETVEAAVGSLSKAGRAVVVGVQPGTAGIAGTHLVMTEQIVTGSRYCNKRELANTLQLVASGAVTPVVGQRLPLAEVEMLFEALRDGSLLGRGALTF